MRLLFALLALFLLAPTPAYAAPGDVKLECPISLTPVVDGQTVVCVYRVEASTAPTTTTTSTTTTAPVPTTSSTVVPTTTTTTLPPSPTLLKGWQLTADNVGLKPHGLSCDTLPLYIGPARPLPGNTISGYRIEVPLDLSNGHILIEKSCIKPNGFGSHNEYLVTTTTCSGNSCWATENGNVTIRDSEITAEHLPNSDRLARSDGFIGVGTLQRNYIHGMGSGISFFETGTVHSALAENNYVRGLRSYGDSHNEAATIRDFRNATGRTVKFLNNRLDCSSGNATGGLFIQPTWLPIHNGLVQGNYIEGEGYNLYLERTTNASYGNMQAIDNRFRPTGWGPSATPSGPGWAVWRDNYRYDATRPDGRGAVVNP